jgi:hypothetical protein
MIMKTAMGIATNNLAASGDESLLGARLRANCDQAGVQAAEEGLRPALLLLMSGPVNAWTPPILLKNSFPRRA